MSAVAAGAEGRSGGAPDTGLLQQIVAAALDADYQVAAERVRRAGGSGRPARRTTTAAVVLVLGVMLAVSAVRTQQLKPADAAERDQLVAQIHAREARLDILQTQVSTLEADVAAGQSRASDRRDAQRRISAALLGTAAVAGSGAVSGPGMRVVATDAAGSVGSPSGGVILDTDLQALVNGLWTAGAEAISINGNRLTSLTAIRFAGRAITVDYRSLTPPYVVEAIGDPDTMPARLLETAGGQAWLGLRQNFGIGFRTESVDRLLIPADPVVTLRSAQPVVTR